MPKQSKNTKKKQQKGSFMAFVTSPTFKYSMGVLLMGFALFLLISMLSYPFTFAEDASGQTPAANWAGYFGGRAANELINNGVGIAAFAIPFILVIFGCMLMKINLKSLLKYLIYPVLVMLWLPLFMQLCFGSLFDQWNLGGLYGKVADEAIRNALGIAGEVILLLVTFVAFGVFAFKWNNLFNKLPSITSLLQRTKRDEPEMDEEVAADTTVPVDDEPETEPNIIFTKGVPDDVAEKPEEAPEDEEIVVEEGDTEEEEVVVEEEDDDDTIVIEDNGEEMIPAGERDLLAELGPYDQRKDLSMYKFPSPELLKDFADQQGGVSREEQLANQRKIIETLRHFNIGVKKIVETIGPTVTLFEIIPEDGVRIVRIQNLEKDIMLSLSATGIRIICPIPGKGTIGIEVPNAHPKVVGMRPLIQSTVFQESKAELPVVMGRTITNGVFTFDLASTPHLIVAGATGQGKSVGLNAIITSLLYAKHPSELKFVLIDPKQLEFSIYADIERHYLAKLAEEDSAVITDSKNVIHTLEAVCQEMDNRYHLLALGKVRNIVEYNRKFKERRLNPSYGHRYLPYLVVVVDEFGDLIATEGKKIEAPIQRITQKARAAGIHMILATQRPSVNVITGVIKANCPTRIAFRVISKIDSMTILDCSGADQLVGRGDMLYSKGDSPQRVQCAFVDTPEVEAIVEHIHSQQSYPEAYELPEPVSVSEEGGQKSFSTLECDKMFNEVAEYVVTSQQGSTSNIQRRFEIGFNRAGRLMDQLEAAGIVGPARGSKPREVLVKSLPELDALVASLQ